MQFFDEKFEHPLTALVGLVFTVAGVALVRLECEEEENNEIQEEELPVVAKTKNSSSSSKSKSTTSYYGILMAMSNIVLHTLAATLTKKYGAGMSTWEISFVRFGFSGVCMLIISATLQLRDKLQHQHHPSLLTKKTNSSAKRTAAQKQN